MSTKKWDIGHAIYVLKESGIVTAAHADVADRDWSDETRSTVLSRFVAELGIDRRDAFEWSNAYRVRSALDAAGVNVADVAPSFAKAITADADLEVFSAHVATAMAEAIDSPKLTQAKVRELAVDAGVIAGKPSKGKARSADVVDITTPASRAIAAVNVLVEVTQEGYTIPMALRRKLEAILKASAKVAA
jgi:hypothetical protein